LNRFCSWSTILPLLGSTMRAAALPARATCPLCSNNTLQVYKDAILGGQWYWCPGCDFAGDSIQLAAVKWGMSPDSAILKLMAAGVRFPAEVDDDAIAGYLADHVDRIEKIDAFWQAARRNTEPLRGPLLAFGRGLGIPGVRPRDWLTRGGQFVGVADRHDVVRCFQAGQGTEQNPRLEEGGHRIFKGKNWDQVVMIAHHDLPGRLRGLLLIGREAKYPDDFIYRRVGVPVNLAGLADPGVSMLDAILTPNVEFGDMIFLCTDPVEAVRLQLAHLAENGRPLPLVGTWGITPSVAWDVLPHRPSVTFGPESTAIEAGRLVRQARKLRGTVGRPPTRPGRSPRDVLRAVARDAVSWNTKLESHLESRPPHEAETVFLAVAMEPGDAARFLRDCRPENAAKVAGLSSVAGSIRSVEVGKCAISEVDGVWKKAKTGEMVSDTIIRVTRIVSQKRQGRILFEGTLTRRGKEVPFVIDRNTTEHAPAMWIRRVALEAGLGMPNLSPSWGRKLFRAAQLFHEPTFVETDGVLGWDDARNVFAFPSFVIAADGHVEANDAALVGPHPALRFAPPDGFSPEQLDALSVEDETTRLLWATAAVVAAQAIAPSLGLEPTSAAFYGFGAVHAMPAAATAMGCASIILAQQASITIARYVAAREAYNWPVMLNNTGHGREDHLVSTLPPGVVHRVGEWTAAVLSIAGGWAVVEVRDRDISILPITKNGPFVLPNYIRHFCADRPYVDGESLVDAVLGDMAAWFGARGGNAGAVRRAAEIVRADDPTRAADRFADMVARMYYAGDLESTRADMGAAEPYRPALTVLPDGLLHVPGPAIARVLARRRAPDLDAALVTRGLSAAGVLVAESDHGGHPGWVVREQWWSDRLVLWRAHNRDSVGGP
jgi:hypothetical protein